MFNIATQICISVFVSILGCVGLGRAAYGFVSTVPDMTAPFAASIPAWGWVAVLFAAITYAVSAIGLNVNYFDTKKPAQTLGVFLFGAGAIIFAVFGVPPVLSFNVSDMCRLLVYALGLVIAGGSLLAALCFIAAYLAAGLGPFVELMLAEFASWVAKSLFFRRQR